ncbi:MAG: ABC transporter permease subunit [Thermoleophilia bacterium]|nr:ABC transporter permease subunit [Gaiellaceae bacterium]MDW8339522.1 ABC transporter permease subunit [Thermoleophilia bacterium]
MAAELVRAGVRDHRRGLAVWCLGVVGYIALIAAIFPSLEGSPGLSELVASYPEVVRSLFGLTEGADITSGPGFLDVELFSFMLPLLVLVQAIGAGAGAFAGEEDAGRLELVLAYPIRRREALLAQGAGVTVQVLALCLAAAVAMLVLDPLLGLGLATSNILAACSGLATIGLFHGWLALGLGAAGGSRALAIGLPTGIAVAAYLVNGLYAIAGWLHPFRVLSPFWLVGSSPLQTGIDWAGALLVVLAGAVALSAGAALVERRDLRAP